VNLAKIFGVCPGTHDQALSDTPRLVTWQEIRCKTKPPELNNKGDLVCPETRAMSAATRSLAVSRHVVDTCPRNSTIVTASLINALVYIPSAVYQGVGALDQCVLAARSAIPNFPSVSCSASQ
jgi:hypothetical protein